MLDVGDLSGLTIVHTSRPGLVSLHAVFNLMMKTHVISYYFPFYLLSVPPSLLSHLCYTVHSYSHSWHQSAYGIVSLSYITKEIQIRSFPLNFKPSSLTSRYGFTTVFVPHWAAPGPSWCGSSQGSQWWWQEAGLWTSHKPADTCSVEQMLNNKSLQ